MQDSLLVAIQALPCTAESGWVSVSGNIQTGEMLLVRGMEATAPQTKETSLLMTQRHSLLHVFWGMRTLGILTGGCACGRRHVLCHLRDGSRGKRYRVCGRERCRGSARLLGLLQQGPGDQDQASEVQGG